MGKDRLVVFIGFNPKSQQNLKKLSLLIEKMRKYYEVSLVYVPDDISDELPYIRVEPAGVKEGDEPLKEIDLQSATEI
jgi:hypothetical protein